MTFRVALSGQRAVLATCLRPRPAHAHALMGRRLLSSTVCNRVSQKHLSSTQKSPAASSSAAHAIADSAPVTSSRLDYLKTLTTKELVSYFCIGWCTLNGATLAATLKAFPYIPVGIMKWFISSIYCGGDTAAEVIETGKRLAARNINNMMLSYTVENSEGTKNLDIDGIVQETIKSIDTILVPHTECAIARAIERGGTANDVPAGYVALKPSALVADPAGVMKNYRNPAYTAQWQQLVANCSRVIQHIYDRNQELALKYPDREVPLLVGVIDAEKFELQQAVYELQRILYRKYNPVDKPVSVVGTIQMYLKQSYGVLLEDIRLAQEQHYKVGLKLVRGAYIHSEADRKNVIHDAKQDTDANFNRGTKLAIEDILASDTPTIGHLVVASHNRDSQVIATNLLAKYGSDNPARCNVTLGQLLGMADDITFELVNKHGVKNIIKYVPWGPPLETKDYLFRRLEENGDAVRADNGWPLVKAVSTVLFKRLFRVQ